MIVGNESTLESMTLESPEVKNAAMKVLISGREGWKDHVMRIVELDDGGYSPKHSHPWPHFNYVIEGEGVLNIEGDDRKLTAGSYAVVPPDTLHQYRNAGSRPFRFICIVPTEGHIV